MRAWKLVAMGVVVALVVLFGFGLTRDASLLPSPLVGSTAPDFRLKRLESEDTVRLSGLRGHPVVVNFWASWCLACKQEHPALVRAFNRYADQGVELVGIVFQDTKSNAVAYLEEHGGGWTQLTDPDSRTAIDYGVYGIPETFFIDPSGVVQHKHIGPVTDEILETEIQKLRVAKVPDGSPARQTPAAPRPAKEAQP